eukprot:UN11056
MEIMTDPVNIGCSHIFCSLCLSRAVGASADTLCPTCRQPFLIKHVRCDRFAKRMIGDLRIKCPNHQITEKRNVLIQQRTHDIHHRSSGPRRSQRERPIANTNNNSNSRSRSRSRDRNDNNSNNNEQKEAKENKEMDEKQASEPPAQNICSWSGEYRQLEHHLNECEFAIIPCERCYIPIFRKSSAHEQSCPWKRSACSRCNQEYRQCDLAIHRCPFRSEKMYLVYSSISK